MDIAFFESDFIAVFFLSPIVFSSSFTIVSKSSSTKFSNLVEKKTKYLYRISKKVIEQMQKLIRNQAFVHVLFENKNNKLYLSNSSKTVHFLFTF